VQYDADGTDENRLAMQYNRDMNEESGEQSF
jgi:hypothetical protein